MKKTRAKPKTTTGADRYLIFDHGDFRHYGHMDYKGHIIFWETGAVTVQWNRAAAIASLYGAGNRRIRATIKGGKRVPPKLDPLFELIEDCRFLADFREATGDPLPTNPADDRVPKFLETSFRDIAWQMVSAVLQGNADSLRDIADTVALSESIRKDKTLSGQWDIIANAVQSAAIKAQKAPTRKQVEEELKASSPNHYKDLTGDLGRMGLGWLAQKAGRPSEKHGTKRGRMRP